MSIVLCGMGGSGKDTVKRLLIEKGYNSIVNFTSRPMRDGEKDGREYYFVDNDYFMDYADSFFETRIYKDEWMYGSKLSHYQNANGVGILTPSGCRLLKKHCHEAFIVYLATTRKTALMRMLQRGDNIDECYRRNVSDVGMFAGVEDEADYTLYTDFLTPNEIAEVIDNAYCKWERGESLSFLTINTRKDN